MNEPLHPSSLGEILILYGVAFAAQSSATEAIGEPQ